MQYRIMLDFIIKDEQVILLDIGGHELYEKGFQFHINSISLHYV